MHDTRLTIPLSWGIFCGHSLEKVAAVVVADIPVIEYKRFQVSPLRRSGY